MTEQYKHIMTRVDKVRSYSGYLEASIIGFRNQIFRAKQNGSDKFEEGTPVIAYYDEKNSLVKISIDNNRPAWRKF